MLESLFNKFEELQVLRTHILKKSAKGCLVHNMSLKTQKLDIDATETFVSEFRE